MSRKRKYGLINDVFDENDLKLLSDGSKCLGDVTDWGVNILIDLLQKQYYLTTLNWIKDQEWTLPHDLLNIVFEFTNVLDFKRPQSSAKVYHVLTNDVKSSHLFSEMEFLEEWLLAEKEIDCQRRTLADDFARKIARLTYLWAKLTPGKRASCPIVNTALTIFLPIQSFMFQHWTLVNYENSSNGFSARL